MSNLDHVIKLKSLANKGLFVLEGVLLHDSSHGLEELYVIRLSKFDTREQITSDTAVKRDIFGSEFGNI
jgi:hypothetical protein